MIVYKTYIIGKSVTDSGYPYVTQCDSDFQRSNINSKENKPDGIDLISNGLDYCVRNNEGKNLWFSVD